MRAVYCLPIPADEAAVGGRASVCRAPSQETWVPVPAVTLTGCVTLTKQLTSLIFLFLSLNMSNVS